MKFKLVEAAESKICCICKKPFDGYGNNAEPVCSGSCCDECNMKEVIPARLRDLKKSKIDIVDESLTEGTIHISKEEMSKLDQEVEEATKEVAKYNIPMISRKNSAGDAENVPDFEAVPEDQRNAAKSAYERYKKALEARPDRAKNITVYDESLNEGNSVSGKIPPALDSFLQDIAQMYQTIDYGDIMDHDYTEDDIRKLNNLRRRFITWAQYDEDDEEVKAKFDEIANKVAEILKSVDESINEGRNNPYFTPYGYRDAAKVLNRTAPEYYWHLKEIEMDRGDGIKLANYALKKGLPVMLDKNSDLDYPEFYLKDGSSEYHWGDYFYTYGFTNPDAADLVPYEGNLDILNTEKDDNKMNEAISDRYLIDLEKAKNLTENDMLGKSGMWFYGKPSGDGWVEKYYLSYRKAGSRWSKYVSTKVENDCWVVKIANEAGGMPFDSFDEAKAWLVDALEGHLNESDKMNEDMSVRAKLKALYPELDFGDKVEEGLDESIAAEELLTKVAKELFPQITAIAEAYKAACEADDAEYDDYYAEEDSDLYWDYAREAKSKIIEFLHKHVPTVNTDCVEYFEFFNSDDKFNLDILTQDIQECCLEDSNVDDDTDFDIDESSEYNFMEALYKGSDFDDHDDENEIDYLYHNASEEELRKMGAFDNLNDEEDDPWENDLISEEFDDAFDEDLSEDLSTVPESKEECGLYIWKISFDKAFSEYEATNDVDGIYAHGATLKDCIEHLKALVNEQAEIDGSVVVKKFSDKHVDYSESDLDNLGYVIVKFGRFRFW